MTPAPLPAPTDPAPAAPPPPKSRVWLWIVAACVLQAAVWAVWLTVASRHKVAEVPLTTPAAGRR